MKKLANVVLKYDRNRILFGCMGVMCFLVISITFKQYASIVHQSPQNRPILRKNQYMFDKNMAKFRKLDSHHIQLAIKQISLAQRFERHAKLREDLSVVNNQLIKLNCGYPIGKNPRDKTTIIFNAVNEIKNLQFLLEDLKTLPKWAKSTNILLGLTKKLATKHSNNLKTIKQKLSKFRLSILQHSDNIGLTLKSLLDQTNTRYVLLTKALRKLDNDLELDVFLKPLTQRTAGVVTGSIVFPNDQWETGCHQSKLVWSQYKTQSGSDVFDERAWTFCDQIDGPFAMSKKVLTGLLNTPNEFLYTELIYILKKEKMIIKSHLPSIFHVEESTNFQYKLDRSQWQDFIVRNKITEIITDTSHHRKHFEFDYKEAKSECRLSETKKNMLRPRACMRDLHFMLLNSYHIFDKYGYQYTTDDGSCVAATKLQDTLPWDHDQDMAFRTQNFSHMMKHKHEFEKLGMYLNPELNKPCYKDIDQATWWTCGYIGIKGDNFRLEAWGQYVLIGDFYQPWKILPKFKPMFTPKNRIIGNDTKVMLGDHWSQMRTNPGQYIRGKYGVDVLRHAKHWQDLGLKNMMGDYKTASHFEQCPVEGHHNCMDQYLADGNIQLQQPWA